ncbi:MAG: membrane protein insertion efficiency factor YidD [Endomicrobiales bacterium]|nr:membrane protein insertion efficiency factor YidD [Endomicrobiales bacterium]
MKKVILSLIRIYQKTISGGIGHCRFYPSCSQYTYEAVENYGVLKGGLLGAKRVLQCHPFGKSGYDPIPGKVNK